MPAHRSFVLLAIVSLLSTSAHATTGEWEGIALKLKDSVVPITYEGSGACTGFVIHKIKNYVLTAAHCYSADAMFADMIPAIVIAKDGKQDLLVLEVKDLNREALHLADKGPAIGQQVASFGYGYALERPLFRLAYISDNAARIPELEGGPFVVTDAAFVGGQSGGPVVNIAGEVVMIVQRASNIVGVGVDAETIKDRVGRYFEKVVKP